jgi:cell division transport system ATP-binding protein
VIELRQVSKIYPNGHAALDEVSFSLDSGEMAFVLGHSGAGRALFLG